MKKYKCYSYRDNKLFFNFVNIVAQLTIYKIQSSTEKNHNDKNLNNIRHFNIGVYRNQGFIRFREPTFSALQIQSLLINLPITKV